MRSSFKDQMSLEQLRKEFEKFAELRVARELPDFYQVRVFRTRLAGLACLRSTVVFVVVFILNRSFYPTTSAVPPVSFLIHPREIQIVWCHRL